MLTASGGPFRGRTRASLKAVTPQEALAHPTWDMGLVVTTNSATLVNKGLEVIEAHLLFGVGYDDIDVTVHPQSIVHSMVEFVDGSTIAQASPPDMRLPISLGLDCPIASREWAFRSIGRRLARGRSSHSTKTFFPLLRSRSAWERRGARFPRYSMRRTSKQCSPSTRDASATSTFSKPLRELSTFTPRAS